MLRAVCMSSISRRCTLGSLSSSSSSSLVMTAATSPVTFYFTSSASISAPSRLLFSSSSFHSLIRGTSMAASGALAVSRLAEALREKSHKTNKPVARRKASASPVTKKSNVAVVASKKAVKISKAAATGAAAKVVNNSSGSSSSKKKKTKTVARTKESLSVSATSAGTTVSSEPKLRLLGGTPVARPKPSLNLSFRRVNDDEDDDGNSNKGNLSADNDNDEENEPLVSALNDEHIFDVERNLLSADATLPMWRRASIFGSSLENEHLGSLSSSPSSPAGAGGADGDEESANEAETWAHEQLDRLTQRLSKQNVKLDAETLQEVSTSASSAALAASAAAATTDPSSGIDRDGKKQPAAAMQLNPKRRRNNNEPAPWMIPDSMPKHLDTDLERQTRLAIRSLMMYYHSCVRYARPQQQQQQSGHQRLSMAELNVKHPHLQMSRPFQAIPVVSAAEAAAGAPGIGANSTAAVGSNNDGQSSARQSDPSSSSPVPAATSPDVLLQLDLNTPTDSVAAIPVSHTMQN